MQNIQVYRQYFQDFDIKFHIESSLPLFQVNPSETKG